MMKSIKIYAKRGIKHAFRLAVVTLGRHWVDEIVDWVLVNSINIVDVVAVAVIAHAENKYLLFSQDVPKPNTFLLWIYSRVLERR